MAPNIETALNSSLDDLVRGNKGRKGNGRGAKGKGRGPKEGARKVVQKIEKKKKEKKPVTDKASTGTPAARIDMSLEDIVKSQGKRKGKGKGAGEKKAAAKASVKVGGKKGGKGGGQKLWGGAKKVGGRRKVMVMVTSGKGRNAKGGGGGKGKWGGESWGKGSRKGEWGGKGGGKRNEKGWGKGKRDWDDSWDEREPRWARAGKENYEQSWGRRKAPPDAWDRDSWRESPPPRGSWGQSEKGSWGQREKDWGPSRGIARPAARGDGPRFARGGSPRPVARSSEGYGAIRGLKRGFQDDGNERRELSSKKIKVVNIPRDLDMNDIKEAFESEAGRIVDCRLERGTAWISFSNPKDARKAVDKFDRGELNGKKIEVTFDR